MNRKTAFALVLGLVTATGVWLLKISTPFGLGLTDDAISYIAASRALLAGQGFTRIWLATGFEPITHWPPAFPATLAFISLITRLDPYRSARILNGLAFGFNAGILGFLGYKMTKSPRKKGLKSSPSRSKDFSPYFAGIFLSFLFLSNPALLRLHAQALSEPLYLFISLLAILAFMQTFEGGVQKKRLVITGILTGISYLTRYAALSLIATFIAAIFVLSPTWKKRFVSLFYFLAGLLPVTLAWMLRNKLVGGNATNRVIEWHPVSRENLIRGARNFFQFIFPLPNISAPFVDNLRIILLLPILILFFLLIWLLPKSIRYFLSPQKNARPPVLAFLFILYIFSYLGSLLVSLTFFDAATPLNDRILSPIYVALLIVFVFFLGEARLQSKIISGIAHLSAVLLLVFFTAAQLQTVAALQESPLGFASWRWRESTVMEAIRKLPPDVKVHTNQPPAVYFWTGRASYRLWDEQPPEVRQNGDVLAVFFPVDRHSEAFQRWLKKMSAGLEPIEKSGLGNLYQRRDN